MAEIGIEAGIDAHALSKPVASASVRLESTGVVNFAMQQHRVPLVARISITNHSAAEIVDARVALRLANGDAQAWERIVARIGPGDTYNLTPDSFVLDGATMSSRTEAERTDIQVVVSWGQDRIEHSTPVELLAFNQWPGARIAPELLAAFITPNHPAIADLLRAARSRSAVHAEGGQGADRSVARALQPGAPALVSGVSTAGAAGGDGRVRGSVRRAGLRCAAPGSAGAGEHR